VLVVGRHSILVGEDNVLHSTTYVKHAVERAILVEFADKKQQQQTVTDGYANPTQHGGTPTPKPCLVNCLSYKIIHSKIARAPIVTMLIVSDCVKAILMPFQTHGPTFVLLVLSLWQHKWRVHEQHSLLKHYTSSC